MKVILVKACRLGKPNDIVEVASGYFRNYLLPNGFAVSATNDNIESCKKREIELQNADIKLRKEAEKNKEILSDKVLLFIKQAGEDSKLYGSLSAKEVVNAILEKHNIKLKYTNVHFSEAIRSTGMYEAHVNLYHDIKAKVYVNIARNDTESEIILRNHISKVSSAEQNLLEDNSVVQQ